MSRVDGRVDPKAEAAMSTRLIFGDYAGIGWAVEVFIELAPHTLYLSPNGTTQQRPRRYLIIPAQIMLSLSAAALFHSSTTQTNAWDVSTCPVNLVSQSGGR